MSPHGQRRSNPGLRWLNVAVRGLHLAAVIGLGAALLGAPLSPSTFTITALKPGPASSRRKIFFISRRFTRRRYNITT